MVAGGGELPEEIGIWYGQSYNIRLIQATMDHLYVIMTLIKSHDLWCYSLIYHIINEFHLTITCNIFSKLYF